MEGLMKERDFFVEGITCDGCVETLSRGIKGIKGVTEARVDTSGRITVRYDLYQTNLKAIEETVGSLNYPLAGGVLSRLRRGWIHYTEQNEYDNHAHPIKHCCSVTENGTVYYPFDAK